MLLIFGHALFRALPVFSQKETELELLHANSLEGNERFGKNVFRLTGNVQFKHENALMNCDSAWRYSDENRFDAFGNIHINQGDSVHIYGDVLKYNGRTRLAEVTGNVRMTDATMVLVTDKLIYNLSTETAFYTTGGKITDKENVLTSSRGYYTSQDKMLFFKDEVILDNPRYVMKGDTLKYSTITKTSFFTGPTTIDTKTADSTLIYCENGWYNTETEKSFFSRRAFIQNKTQRVKSDSLFYDRKVLAGEGFANVFITDFENDVIVQGDYGKFFEADRKSFVTGHALFIRNFKGDSMFLHADTLFAIWDSLEQQRTYHAFHRARIYKSDLQASCDSLVYSTSDSVISFYREPVLWSNENQMTADSVRLKTSGDNLDKIYLFNTAFISSIIDSSKFNQVRGKNMTGYFSDNKIHRIEVEGNGQSIYYVKNKKDQITGMNRADCSNMLIFVNENKIKSISMIQAPEGTLFPIADTGSEETLLKGFTWQASRRPAGKNDLLNTPPTH